MNGFESAEDTDIFLWETEYFQYVVDIVSDQIVTRIQNAIDQMEKELDL